MQLFYVCVVCRHTSLLDLKQRRNGVFHFRSTNSFSGGTRGAKRLIFCTTQAKLILEKFTTLFFEIYFTFLFIQTFVPHSPYVPFFFKAVVIFFVFMSRRRTQSMGSIQLVYLKKNLFLV